MKTRFRESFAEDLAALTDAGLLRRIKRVIEQVEAASTFQQIAHLKRLEARGKYYRILVGNHRVNSLRAPFGQPAAGHLRSVSILAPIRPVPATTLCCSVHG